MRASSSTNTQSFPLPQVGGVKVTVAPASRRRNSPIRSGRPLRIGEFRRRDAGATVTFTPPTCGKGNDWVLVLDDARMKYPPPGRCPEARSGAAG